MIEKSEEKRRPREASTADVTFSDIVCRRYIFTGMAHGTRNFIASSGVTGIAILRADPRMNGRIISIIIGTPINGRLVNRKSNNGEEKWKIRIDSLYR